MSDGKKLKKLFKDTHKELSKLKPWQRTNKVPMEPNGYKQFGKAITKLSDKEIESVFNRENEGDKKAEAEMLEIQKKFNAWWDKYSAQFCYGCATNSEAEGIRQVAAIAFEYGYGEGFSVGKFGP